MSELEKIRNMYGVSRKVFGEKFLGVTGTCVMNYEKGITPVPESIMMLARYWRKVMEDVKIEKD